MAIGFFSVRFCCLCVEWAKGKFLGAVSGAIFGPGAAIGTAFALKVGMAGAEGAFSSIMDQVLRGEKINWKTVAMDAGIGMVTLGVLDNKYAKKLGSFIGKIGNKISPASIKSGISKGMDKAAVGYQKALEKLSDAGSVLGKKMKGFPKVLDVPFDGNSKSGADKGIERGFDPPTFYSVINESGGTVHVSTDKILQKHFSSILDEANRKINLLTGAHGTIDGTLIREPQIFR